MYQSSLIFFLQKCGAHLRAVLKTIVIPLSTVFTRMSAAALIKSPLMRAYLSNYCNLQLKSLLHLGQNVITSIRTLLHLGSFITFRPSLAAYGPFGFNPRRFPQHLTNWRSMKFETMRIHFMFAFCFLSRNLLPWQLEVTTSLPYLTQFY